VASIVQQNPAMFDHVCAVYKAMRAQAEMDEEYSCLVYEGHLTQLFRRLKLSVPYYTTIKNRLIAMGCIEQIKRGGGAALSRWLLWREPTLDEYHAVTERRPRKEGDRYSIVEQRIRDLQKLAATHGDELEELRRLIVVLQKEVEAKVGHDV
jgi:hypothetical protein